MLQVRALCAALYMAAARFAGTEYPGLSGGVTDSLAHMIIIPQAERAVSS